MEAKELIGGCALHLAVDEDLVYGRQRITKAVDRHLSFATVSVVLLVDSNEISAIGRLRRRPTSTTFERNVSIDLIAYEFERIAIDDLAESVSPKFRPHVRNALHSEGEIPEKTWLAIRDALGRLYPQMAEHIDHVEMQTLPKVPAHRASGYSIPALEKDAVSLALSICGVGLSPLDGWRLPEEPAPYLAGISSVTMIEDQIIQRDLLMFGDWSLWSHDAIGSARFTNGKHWVTVTNVNRTPVERTLGVDLIYYHHKYTSYIVVQYKRFMREETSTSTGGLRTAWTYRPSKDRNFTSELERMRNVQRMIASHPSQPDDYRLNPGPCYVKLCEPDVKLSSPDLAKGMYLSLEYLDLLLSSSMLRGPRGGIAITYDAVQRHLTNSQFIDLVQSGWIGSTGTSTLAISEYITAALNGDHSVILAASGS